VLVQCALADAPYILLIEHSDYDAFFGSAIVYSCLALMPHNCQCSPVAARREPGACMGTGANATRVSATVHRITAGRFHCSMRICTSLACRLADHLHGELTASVHVLCGDGFQVIRRANDTPFGLASAVFSKDLDSVNTISRGLKAGTVWVNCYNLFDNAVPFGGYKESGVGRERGEDCLEHYTQVGA
jgi:hypothetical protein